MFPLNVLVVDSEPLVREMTCAMLMQDGHSVESSYSATDALDKFRFGDIDLVIAEYWLPGTSGGALALTIKKQLRPRPVIVMASHLPTYQLPGVDAVLVKPFSLLQLRQAIQAVAIAQQEIA